MAFEQYISRALIESKLLTVKQIDELVRERGEEGTKRLEQMAIDKGYITQEDLAVVLKSKFNVEYVQVDTFKIDRDLVHLVPEEFSRKNTLVPYSDDGTTLRVAMEDPFNPRVVQDLNIITKRKIIADMASATSIELALAKLYGKMGTDKALEEFKADTTFTNVLSAINNETFDEQIDNAPIVKLVNSIVERAIRDGASDIHIEPGAEGVLVRIRIDGVLQELLTVPSNAHKAMVARVKIMSNLNIAEKRVPQDGRFAMSILGKTIDVRVSVLPSVYGEKCVMRLLDRSDFLRAMDEIGFTDDNIGIFKEIIHNPHGIILVCGPTGSGKSTTLYTVLNELNDVRVNITTVEDPVEFLMDGITQVQVNEKAGMTFASGFRSILRQDPDIIMVGEMRDEETIDIAVRAAITGHLVFSTIHTNDSVSAITRLVDMGVPSYMISTALVGVIAQRLVRVLCPYCKEKHLLTPEEMYELNRTFPEGTEVYHAKGCEACNHTGYRGRTAVHEIYRVGREERDLINKNASVDVLRDAAIKSGMTTLLDDCCRLLLEGKTTVEEVIKTAYTHD
ncbi:MAG: type II/IV secretion system protein [Clostridia bacterium]|nr:type II/IV secretion system protein [Clostridia bacterium]